MPSLPPSFGLRGLLTPTLALCLSACGPGEQATTPAEVDAQPPVDGAQTARSGSAEPARRASVSGPALDARFELEVVGKPEGLACVDLDGDGKDELIVLQRTPGRLSILTQLPDGWRLRATARDLPVNDYSLGPVVLGAGSDAVRIAFASRSTHEVLVIDPLGGNGEQVVARLELDSAPRAITSGSLNDDLGERLLIATAGGELLHWNTSSDARKDALAEREVSCLMSLADGSGVLVGDQGLRTLTFHGEREANYQLDGMPRALLELDLDASGDNELAVAGGDRALWIFGLEDEGGPATWFSAAEPLAYELDRIPLRLARGDVSGDGRDDLITLFFGQLAYRVLSMHTQTPEVAHGYAGQAPWDIAAGDFDGDGRCDLAIANRDARRVGLLYGAQDGGLRRAARFATGRAPHSVMALRVGTEEHKALAVIHSLEDSWSVYTRTAEGWRTSERMPAGPGANHIRRVDLQVDGQDDLAWTTTDAQGSKLHFAAVPGVTSEVALPGPVDIGGSASDLVICDLDGDQVVEAYICDEEARALRVVNFGWNAASQAISTQVSSLELPAGPTSAVAFTSRGERVLMVGCADANGGSGLAMVRSVNGTLAVASFALSNTLPIDVTAADVNANGELDLVVLSKATAMDNGGNAEVWVRGDVWSRVVSAPTGQRPYAVAAGDWNGDGRAELVASAQNSHNVGLWIPMLGADGSLRLERQADLGAGLGPLDVMLEDLDADGVLELIVTGAFSDDVSVISSRR